MFVFHQGAWYLNNATPENIVLFQAVLVIILIHPVTKPAPTFVAADQRMYQCEMLLSANSRPEPAWCMLGAGAQW